MNPLQHQFNKEQLSQQHQQLLPGRAVKPPGPLRVNLSFQHQQDQRAQPLSATPQPIHPHSANTAVGPSVARPLSAVPPQPRSSTYPHSSLPLPLPLPSAQQPPSLQQPMSYRPPSYPYQHSQPPPLSARLGEPFIGATAPTLLEIAASLAISGSGPIMASPSPIGPALSKLTALNESMAIALRNDDIDALRSVVDDFFTETGILKYGLYDKASASKKTFEIPCSALPRFQHINAISGVIATAIRPSFVREYFLTAPHPGTGQPLHVGYLLKADNTSWVSTFQSGTMVELSGTLTVHFVVVANASGLAVGGISTGSDGSGLRLESMDFESRGHTEFIPRDLLEGDKSPDSLSGASNATSTTVESKESPTGAKRRAVPKKVVGTRRRSQTKGDEDDAMAASGGTRGLKSVDEGGEGSEKPSIPPSPVGSFGITEMGMRCLEIAESVAQLQDLIGYSLDTSIGPIESLARFVEDRQRQLAPTAAPLNFPQLPTPLAFPSSVPSSSTEHRARSPLPPMPQGVSTFYSTNPSSSSMAYSAEAARGAIPLLPQPSRSGPSASGSGQSPAAVVASIRAILPRTPPPDENHRPDVGNGSATIKGTPNGTTTIDMNGGMGSRPPAPSFLPLSASTTALLSLDLAAGGMGSTGSPSHIGENRIGNGGAQGAKGRGNMRGME